MESKAALGEKELIKRRKQKIKFQINAAKKILREEDEPLKIADLFIHEVFEILKDRIISQNQDIEEHEINQKIRMMVDLNQKIKNSRKR